MTDEILRAYRSLDLEPGSSFEAAKQAYRELVRVWHPDRFQNDPRVQARAQEKLKEINRAYHQLQSFYETSTPQHAGGNFSSHSPSKTQQAPFVPVSPEAQYNCGLSLYQGKGVPQDYHQAYLWFHRSAEQGFGMAQYNVGVMHYQGQGVQKDVQEAVKWFRLAAAQGHAEAQFTLGRIYVDGQHVTKSVRKFIRGVLGTAAVLTGSWDKCEIKKATNPWHRKAIKWFTLAAEQGHVGAQLRLSDLYLNTVGGPRGWDCGIKWAFRAARRGSSEGASRLRVYLGVYAAFFKERGFREVWHLLESVANSGNVQAQVILAEIYVTANKEAHDGKGGNRYGCYVAKNYSEAYKWYTIAVTSGYEPAARRRDELARLMTTSEIEEGQRRAANSGSRPPHSS